jgi:ABC-2 type transport system ATP-binding protein
MGQVVVSVDQLTKQYGALRALDGCCLQVCQGEVFGLLGPNGAGKTTLMRTLLGYLKPTSGSARVFGWDCQHDSVRVRREVAYLPAEAKLFRAFRGSECLEFFSRMHPGGSLTRARSLADRLGLDLKRRVAFMSTGMRQKLALAAVISCSAPLVILDEPTANLDPTVRHEILKMIQEEHRQGRTLILCSHVLSEIEEVCQQAAILRAGQVVHQVDLATLKAVHRMRGRPPADRLSGALAHLPEGAKWVDRQGDHWTIDLSGSLEDHLNWLQQTGWKELRLEPVGLRSIYEIYHACSDS